MKRRAAMVILGLLMASLNGCKRHPAGPAPVASISAKQTLAHCAPGEYPTDAAYSSDGRFLAIAGTDKMVRLFDNSDESAQPRELQPAALPLVIRHAAISPNGLQLAVTLAPGKRPGDASEASSLRVLTMPTMVDAIAPAVLEAEESFDLAAFSPDGNTLAASVVGLEHPRIELRAMPAGNVRVKIDLSTPATAMAFSPDGRLLAVGSGHVLQLNNVGTGDRISRFIIGTARSEDLLTGLRFSRDSATVATLFTDGNLFLWDAATQQQQSTHRHFQADTANPPEPMVLNYSPDGRFLAVFASGQAMLLDPKTLETVAKLEETSKAITSFAFSPSGARLVTTDRSGMARVWELPGK